MTKKIKFNVDMKTLLVHIKSYSRLSQRVCKCPFPSKATLIYLIIAMVVRMIWKRLAEQAGEIFNILCGQWLSNIDLEPLKFSYLLIEFHF